MDDEPVYHVLTEEGRFLVVDAANQTVMACHDEGSANQYAVLLNQAHRKGFKAGYREGRGARAQD